MVKIRLKRIGMRQQPSYRIVAIESRRSRDGEYLESLGYYDPRRKLLTMKLERVEYWLAHGAQPTSTARSLIRRFRKEHPVTEEDVATAEEENSAATASLETATDASQERSAQVNETQL